MRGILIPILTVCLAGLWSGCTTESTEDGPLPQKPVMVMARIKSVALGRTDTAVTLLRYDSAGFLTREIRSTTMREWDSQGRYVGVRIQDSTRYVERVEWVGQDSTIRTQPPFLVLHDRLFNRRPNCWCADSIRHSVGDTYTATRKFVFDSLGNPVHVTLTWANDGHSDVVQFYENTYNKDSLLVETYLTDGESGSVTTTIRFIEYDTLKNVVEGR